MTLAVFDTSSSGHALFVAMRHLVVTAPEADGPRRILDIVQVENPGTTTRVAADSAGATWRLRLPPGITDFQLGESDISPAAVRRDGDVVLVARAVPAGGEAGAGQLRRAGGGEDPGHPDRPGDGAARAAGRGRRRERVRRRRAGRRADGDREPQLHAASPPRAWTPGPSVTLTFGAAGARGRSYVWVIVLAAAPGAGRRGLRPAPPPRRRPRRPARRRGAETPDALVAQIAALDERFEGREAATPPGGVGALHGAPRRAEGAAPRRACPGRRGLTD